MRTAMISKRLGVLAATALLALPAAASAAPAPLHPAFGDAPANFKGLPGALAKTSTRAASIDAKAPVVTKVSPRSAKVGDVLTITGKNFVPGKGKNQVFFYTNAGGGTFTKAADASRTRLKVRVPAKLAALLPANGDKARIRLRVKGKRLGGRSTTRVSPLIAINPDDVGGTGTGVGGA